MTHMSAGESTTTALAILLIARLLGLASDGVRADGMCDYVAILVVFFLYVIVINSVLVLCACAGRCLLSADIDRAKYQSKILWRSGWRSRMYFIGLDAFLLILILIVSPTKASCYSNASQLDQIEYIK